MCREDLSVPANQLPDALVSSTVTPISTLCCYTLSTPTLPSTLYTSTPSSALAISAPVARNGLAVTLRTRGFAGVSRAACTAANLAKMKANSTQLVISPSTLSFGNGTLTRSFAVTATVGGCYSFAYLLSGADAALYEVSIEAPLMPLSHSAQFMIFCTCFSGLQTPVNTTMYILTSESIPAAPALSSVRFTSSGRHVSKVPGSGTVVLRGCSGIYTTLGARAGLLGVCAD